MRRISHSRRAAVISLAALLALPGVAHAKSGGIKYLPDYSDVRGFNNTISSRNYQDQWERYDHAEVDRDMGYAQRLRLNTARVFLSYKAWLASKEKFRTNISDFVRTAYAHGVGTMNVVLEQSDREGITSGVLEDASKWLANSNPDYFDGMVIAETEANTLEAAQLVGMRELPTRKLELLRAGPQDFAALRLLIEEFSRELAPNAIPGTVPRHRFYTPEVEH